MSDYGSEATDKAVKRVERRIAKVYSDAAKDIDQKMQDWQEGHAKRDAKYRQMVKDGKLSQQDYEAWMRGQVFQGKQWQARKKQIQEALLNADKMAMNIVTEGKLGVFATNANYIGYGLEHDSGLSTGFTLYDESTVARLIQDDPQILPMLPPEKAIKKPLAFDYYNRLMNSAITHGIIQGEDIRQIAKRIVKTTAESSYKSAVRNARTAYTGAQNAGRIEGLHQAQKLGIEVKKRWLATLDARTRDSHRDLDGQVQEVDDPFKSPLGDIMFPGDPTADPGNIWNCRCTLVYVYPDYPSDMQRRDAETGEIVGDMTYREWEDMKRGEAPEPEKPEPTKEPEKPIDYFDMETTREISSAMGDSIGRPVDLQGMDKTLAARTARLYTDLANEYGMRASSIGMNNRRAAFGQVNHKYTGEKKLTFSKSMFESPDKLREVLMGEQRKGQTIPIRGGVILDYVQTHEFAHLFGSSLEDGYYNANQPFWREVGAVMREYIDDRSRPLGKYAAQNIDEFMAEAFADGYLNRQPTEYGRKVKEIVDKYFGRRK